MNEFYFAIQLNKIEFTSKFPSDCSVVFGLYSENSEEDEVRLLYSSLKKNKKNNILVIGIDGDEEEGADIALTMYIGKEGRYKKSAVIIFKTIYFTKNQPMKAKSISMWLTRDSAIKSPPMISFNAKFGNDEFNKAESFTGKKENIENAVLEDLKEFYVESDGFVIEKKDEKPEIKNPRTVYLERYLNEEKDEFDNKDERQRLLKEVIANVEKKYYLTLSSPDFWNGLVKYYSQNIEN